MTPAKNLTLRRNIYIPGKRTLGTIYLTQDDPLMPINPDGLPPICYTMEPRHDMAKANVSGSDTAILAGEYPYSIEIHPKYTLPVMRLTHVPGRYGILVHPGTRDADTRGCIMPGTTIIDSPDGRCLAASQKAMEALLLAITGEKTVAGIRRGIRAYCTYPGVITIKDKTEP